MRLRKIIKQSMLLLIVVVLSGISYSCQSSEPAKKAEKADTVKTSQQVTQPVTVSAQKKLVVYYFHTTFRCHSCTMIEQYTKEAVQSGFSEEIKNRQIEMKVINVEENGNEHFVEEYKLYTKSVIISDVEGDKEVSWKNLDKVWTLLGDENKFKEYIQTEIRSSLKG